MKAMILAAGQGTRLRPLTNEVPKPMLRVGGRPLVGYLVELLRSHGVEEIAVNLHHKPDVIRRYLGDGSRLDVRITYSHEEQLLGSAGALKKLEWFFTEPFFVLYGDVLTDVDLTELADCHLRRGAIFTMALYHTNEPERCGIAKLARDGTITRFQEKPAPREVFSHLANAGVYVIEPEALRLVAPATFFDCGAHLVPLLLGRGFPVGGLVSKSYFLDIGSIERFRRAQEDLRSGIVRISSPPPLKSASGASRR